MMLTFVAQLRPYILFAIRSVKHWLVSFGSLWTVQSPSILDVSLPSVSMFEQIDRLSFPRQQRVGGLIWLPGRINSCWKSVCFQGTTGHSRWKGKAHLKPRLCVPSSSALYSLLRITFFSLWVISCSRRKALDGLMNCLAGHTESSVLCFSLNEKL